MRSDKGVGRGGLTIRADNSPYVPRFQVKAWSMGMVGRAVGLAACLVALAATASCSLEQVPIGEWNLIHTVAQGRCPALDWHFLVDGERDISGYVAVDRFRQIATLTGVLNPDDSFQMWATEMGGTRRESVTGRFTSQVVTLSLDGNWICGQQTFRIRPVHQFGLEGGGG
jgi:hypothetical protein